MSSTTPSTTGSISRKLSTPRRNGADIVCSVLVSYRNHKPRWRAAWFAALRDDLYLPVPVRVAVCRLLLALSLTLSCPYAFLLLSA